MTDKGNEEELIANALRTLGDEEEVLAAGMFGCQDLVAPEIAGQTSGALLGDATHNPGGSAIGVLVGGLAAKKAAAEEKGITLKLVVAVTPTKIHILNWGEGTPEERHDIVFDRAHTEVKIKKWGLSRIIKLHDPDSGAGFNLQGSAGRLFSQSGPDKHVIEVLSQS